MNTFSFFVPAVMNVEFRLSKPLLTLSNAIARAFQCGIPIASALDAGGPGMIAPLPLQPPRPLVGGRAASPVQNWQWRARCTRQGVAPGRPRVLFLHEE